MKKIHLLTMVASNGGVSGDSSAAISVTYHEYLLL